MIGNVDDTGLGPMVVAAEEILFRSHRHVRARSGNVRVPREVIWRITSRRNEIRRLLLEGHSFAAALGVVDSVVKALAERVFARGAFGVVGNVIDVGRKERLKEFVDVGGHVGPPQERLHERRAIIQSHLQFDVGPPRMQTDAVHALHAVHRLVITAPDGL